VSKIKKKSVGIYFSLYSLSINLRIRRFNLQSLNSCFPTLDEPSTNEQVYRQFSKTHNYLIEHSDSDKVTSKKNTTSLFVDQLSSQTSCNLRHIRPSYTTQIFEL
jgi:hypothetical protein